MDSPGPGPVMTVLRTGGEEPPEPAPATTRPKVTRSQALIALAVLWAIVITVVVLTRGGKTPAPVTARPTASPSASATPLTVAQIYQTVRPSVVLIRATGGSTSVNGTQETEVATGTGVIVNADGTILTADHVIAGAKTIEVDYVDGTVSSATVATGDAKQDIATLTP